MWFTSLCYAVRHRFGRNGFFLASPGLPRGRGIFTLVARVLRISVLFGKGAWVTCETSGGLFFAACEAFRVWRIGVAVT